MASLIIAGGIAVGLWAWRAINNLPQEEPNPRPSRPSTPSTPSISSRPRRPSTPSTPSIPSRPSTPSIPSIPSRPSRPSRPSIPSTPSTPSTPSRPSIPSIPSIPSRPNTPSTPSRPSIPSIPSRPNTPSIPSRPISTWSKEEGYEATAAAFSVITGVNIISEKDVQKQIAQGKKVTALDIKDVFYGRFSSSKKVFDHQEQLYYIPDSAYDPQHDHDFTNYKGDDTNCTRGGYSYKRPAGWNRKAVQVIGKYEDDVWLGQKGWRDESSLGEWPVSYHGTKIQNVSSIVVDGYDNNLSKRKMYGEGIYSTPDIKVAEHFATGFNYKGEECKCILQNRVNLKKTKEVDTGGGIYFVTPDDGDIRPYGVCIKKI